MEENKVDLPSVAALAYLGDSVFELAVRKRLVGQGIPSSAKLNRAALDYVTATAQSKGAERLIPILSEEELRFYKRGRNLKTSHCPKSADAGEYQRATGLEVLFATLYLLGRHERMDELFEAAFPVEEKDN